MPTPTPGRSTQYFAAEPNVASSPTTVTLALPDATLTLKTDRGVFSAEHVDPGTRLLLLQATTIPQGPVDLVDLGCGYGPIAIMMALRSPQATVWAVDVNERALELCATNADAAGVGDRVRTVKPEDFPAELAVAALWSNPPIRIGKRALHTMLTTWLSRLDTDAQATLVVHKHLGSDSLATWLEQSGYLVNRLASRGGYRIIGVQGQPA